MLYKERETLFIVRTMRKTEMHSVGRMRSFVVLKYVVCLNHGNLEFLNSWPMSTGIYLTVGKGERTIIMTMNESINDNETYKWNNQNFQNT
jgi:hypothetical protein